MNPYLAKLRARGRGTRHPQAPSKPSKPGFEGFEGDRDTCFSDDGWVKTAVEDTPFGCFGLVFAALVSHRPDLVPVERWQKCVADGRRFLSRWGGDAKASGWTARDLFGLHKQPENPHPSYRRLSRYDETGLIWLLQGREVGALTEETAAIRWPSGSITTYRKNNKPGYGPPGDSLDDFQ
jgi:hypothetical protein